MRGRTRDHCNPKLTRGRSPSRYAPKLSVKLLPSGTTCLNKKGGKKMQPDEGAFRGSTVSALIKIRGIFANASVVSVQVDAISLLISSAPAIDPASVFLHDIEKDDDDDEAGAATQGPPKKAKVEAEEDDEF